MTNLFNLIKDSQKGNKDSVVAVIEKFEPKIKSLMYQTQTGNREDLKQELFVSLMKKINDYNLEEVPGLWEFTKKL